MFCTLKLVPSVMFLIFVITNVCATTLKGKHAVNNASKDERNPYLRVPQEYPMSWESGDWSGLDGVEMDFDSPKRQDISLSDEEMVDNRENPFGENILRDEIPAWSSADEMPLNRQKIIDPGFASYPQSHIRLPRPYPFRSNLGASFVAPRIIPVHHYNQFAVPVEVQRNKEYPKPYYVPYKPKPDVKVTHVHVYHPRKSD